MSGPQNCPWLPEHVAELTRRWMAGESCGQIGKAMRMSRGAVIGKFHRLGIKRVVSAPLRAPIIKTPNRRADAAKPWLERSFGQCTWIVSGDGIDAMACCAPIQRGSWCKAHAAIGFVPAKERKESVRGLRRAV